ncbi:helix-turn-helix transcriptional regulator [Candidatus Uhrbacteria bacterium]|nr:helix-turn-helix transcriptional regulator [Candidatus Uhrbacteria bacterium]
MLADNPQATYALARRPLTVREVEVLNLFARGLSAKRAGIRLGITFATVRTHAMHIREKLLAKTCGHAVAVAITHADLAPGILAGGLRERLESKAAAAEKLSPRTIAVASRYARGMTHREIAQELGISESTVRTHAERIRNDLGVSTMDQALATLVYHGKIRVS